MQYIADHDKELELAGNDKYSTTVRYNSTDQNFFALLGTVQGAAVMDLITFYAGDFATRSSDGAVKAVKSVREIWLAGREQHTLKTNVNVSKTLPTPDGEYTIKKPLTMDMFVVLEDIDPPAGMEVPVAGPSTSSEEMFPH